MDRAGKLTLMDLKSGNKALNVALGVALDFTDYLRDAGFPVDKFGVPLVHGETLGGDELADVEELLNGVEGSLEPVSLDTEVNAAVLLHGAGGWTSVALMLTVYGRAGGGLRGLIAVQSLAYPDKDNTEVLADTLNMLLSHPRRLADLDAVLGVFRIPVTTVAKPVPLPETKVEEQELNRELKKKSKKEK